MRVTELRVGLLLYLSGTESIYALLVDQQGHTQKFRLAGWRDVFPLIDKFLEGQERGSFSAVEAPASFRAFSFEWGKRLLPPAECLKAFDVLVIIPHYTLHGLPFHTVWLDDESRFLATSHGITYCSSGTLFTRCVDRNLARREDITEWTFDLAEASTAGAPAPPRRCVGVGSDVIGKHSEDYGGLAKVFTSYFQEPVTFPFATRAAIKNRLKGDKRWEAVCIVSHGYYDSATPDNCGLLLDRDTFGIVIRPIFLHRGTYYDFRDLPFTYLPPEVDANREAELMSVSELKVECLTDAQLIALFGCSTGAGHVVSGGDFNSMAYQWLKAGAPTALANLWEVGIDFLKEWSPHFLENWLVKRQPKAIAWRQAVTQFLENRPEVDPYTWGAIALFGDWL